MEESIKNRNVSYQEIIPELGMRQQAVFNLLQIYGPQTTHQVADKMRLGMESLNGRIKELEEMAFIRANGSQYNAKTKRNNTLWIVCTERERGLIREAKIGDLTERAVHLSLDLGRVASEAGVDLISAEVKRLDRKLIKLYKLTQK